MRALSHIGAEKIIFQLNLTYRQTDIHSTYRWTDNDISGYRIASLLKNGGGNFSSISNSYFRLDQIRLSEGQNSHKEVRGPGKGLVVANHHTEKHPRDQLSIMSFPFRITNMGFLKFSKCDRSYNGGTFQFEQDPLWWNITT